MAAARGVLSLYRSIYSEFPNPTESGGTTATQSGANTLEAILTASGKGDRFGRIHGRIEGELISSPKGYNFVCVVNTVAEFYRDQSDFSNCSGVTDFEKPTGNGGGYIYCPLIGALRLNFQVKGDDLRTIDQLPIQALAPDWTSWAEEHPDQDIGKDWPVRW